LEVLNTHYNHMAINLRCLEFDLRWGMEGTDRIPTEWADIAAEPFCPYKEKVTLRLDKDVLRFFRATGRGCLTRMNKVMRAYMLARLAGVVKGAERDKPLPTMAEELAVETAKYVDLWERRKARVTSGLETEDMDLTLNRMEPRLQWLEKEVTRMVEAED
jgi:uncharacterized protein (DUF4415 family)